MVDIQKQHEKYILDFNDKDFIEKIKKLYNENGVAIITNVFTPEFCDNNMNDIISTFESINPDVDRNDIKNTWTTFNLPPQTRRGMFQCLIGHIQPIWNIRQHKNLYTIFKILYSNIYQKNIDDFIVSFDGMNLIPNELNKNYNEKDWPHLDQTIRNNPMLCIQGQAVLTNTTSAFRCTPKSFLYHNEILDMANVEQKDKSNWCHFKDETNIKKFCESKNLKWQIPMYAPKGSFIIWSSSTIHSAKNVSKIEDFDKNDIWKGWRGVVYVCYRPRLNIKKNVLEKRKQHIINNRLTTHWGEKVFPKRPGGRYIYSEKRHEIIENLLDNPELLYYITGEPLVDLSLI